MKYKKYTVSEGDQVRFKKGGEVLSFFYTVKKVRNKLWLVNKSKDGEHGDLFSRHIKQLEIFTLNNVLSFCFFQRNQIAYKFFSKFVRNFYDLSAMDI